MPDGPQEYRLNNVATMKYHLKPKQYEQNKLCNVSAAATLTLPFTITTHHKNYAPDLKHKTQPYHHRQTNRDLVPVCTGTTGTCACPCGLCVHSLHPIQVAPSLKNV